MLFACNNPNIRSRPRPLLLLPLQLFDHDI
jgi:hypothetical protein